MACASWRVVLGLVAVSFLTVAATDMARAADCTRPATDEEQVQCLGDDLRRTDAQINQVYGQLRGSLDDAGKLALRNEQRAWLKLRDQTCSLDNKESDREKWMQAILANRAQTVCVVRFTNERAAQLAAQVDGKTAPAANASQDLANGDLYEVWGKPLVSTGKWYFEVTIDRGAIAKRAETALFVGAQDPQGSFGSLISLRHADAGQSKVVLGLAVDLDAGWIYGRRDGAWVSGPPGQTNGLQIPPRLATRLGVTSSVTMAALVKDGLIAVNFGGQPFVYAVPDGYKALK